LLQEWFGAYALRSQVLDLMLIQENKAVLSEDGNTIPSLVKKCDFKCRFL
jgi:hypothetical protein